MNNIPNRLHDVMESLQTHLAGVLDAGRLAHRHPVTKGDSSEEGWLTLLKAHLPYRYQADKAIVIDSDGNTSQQQDIVIYDRQYSPALFNLQRQIYVPAESVYAVLEVKQRLDAAYLKYAGAKAASVRILHRSSTGFPTATGKVPAIKPPAILAGIVAYDSELSLEKPAALTKRLNSLPTENRLDLGCALRSGTFEVTYLNGGVALQVARQQILVSFLFRLLRRLQDMRTVPAIDYTRYLNSLRS